MTEYLYFNSPHYSEFVTVRPGDPFRLLPIGTLVKGGRKIEVTREMLERFKLPHFKPPIKLGDHAPETPAGGHIVGLEVREDGLWAIPELNDRGTGAIVDGSYRYHSPEIIWEGGGLEDPDTGETIEGPLIVGDALLHMPHLGERAALYTVEMKQGADDMTETITAPVSFWEKLMGNFRPEPMPEPEPAPQVQQGEADQFAAQLAERQAEVDRLQAEIANIRQQEARAGVVAHFASELADTGLAEDADLHNLLAGIDEETAEALLVRFKALEAQAAAAGLEDEIGATGDPSSGGDAAAIFHAAVTDRMVQDGITYHQAVQAVSAARPELVAEYVARR